MRQFAWVEKSEHSELLPAGPSLVNRSRIGVGGRLLSVVGALGLLGLMAASAAGAEGAALDQAFERFWAAEKKAQVAKASEEILALEPEFEEVLRRLERGRPYSQKVKTGRLLRGRKALFHYILLVPEGYDSAKRYPLRFYLHGGVNRPAPRRRDGSWWQSDRSSADERDHLIIAPVAWNEAMWWHENQAENLPAILKTVRREYNVDENRTSILGISDGGTGAFFHALTRPTPWASIVSLIGHARVLASPSLRIEAQLFSSNLSGQAIYAVNGGRDPLYPADAVEPMLQHFASVGAEVVFRAKPEAGHDLSWLQEEIEPIGDFLDAHPRDPLPDRLSWETDDPRHRGRNHWLRITELDARVSGIEDTVAEESALADPDILGKLQIFPRQRPSGRVDLERQGQWIDAKTRGVRRFELLLSPRQFDFDWPIRVTVNGREVFNGRVRADPRTLLRQAAIDQDRTQLYAAALEIAVEEGL